MLCLTPNYQYQNTEGIKTAKCTLCSKKSNAKIQITITTAYLIRIKYPISGFNYHLSDVNVANFNKIHRTVSEQQLFLQRAAMLGLQAQETAPRKTAENTVRFDGSQPPRSRWKFGDRNNTTIFDNIDIGDLPTRIHRCSSRLRR